MSSPSGCILCVSVPRAATLLIYLQAVASKLMGVKLDKMMDTEDLVAWNSDQADKPRYHTDTHVAWWTKWRLIQEPSLRRLCGCV